MRRTSFFVGNFVGNFVETINNGKCAAVKKLLNIAVIRPESPLLPGDRSNASERNLFLPKIKSEHSVQGNLQNFRRRLHCDKVSDEGDVLDPQNAKPQAQAKTCRYLSSSW